MDYDLMYMADFYKVSHKAQYPANVTRVHSTLVARGANYNMNIRGDKFYWFGLKLYLRKLEMFAKQFFELDPWHLQELLTDYKNFLDARLGGDNDVSHWGDLYNLGHLPLKIAAVPEFTLRDFQTPVLTVENTHPDFPWLTGFIETTLLSNVWGASTAANRAFNIRRIIEEFMKDHTDFERHGIDFMCHDFSYRGMMGDEAATYTGCGHLAIFKGSDTIPAIRAMEDVYGEVTGFSVPATEHSVMCAGGAETERETFERILDLYPTGIVSIVSDTWDYYKVLKEIIPSLKDKILERDGKTVIRPDSGDPIKIVCGGGGYESSLELLDATFGHTLDSTGLKILNSKIGLIYGDGMNAERIYRMLQEMTGKGWSPLNIVFGIGAFTYQYMTRDELGWAFKATAAELDGERWVNLQKAPKTDATKKSLTGRFEVGTHDLETVFEWKGNNGAL